MGQDTATDPAPERSALRPPRAAPRLELLGELSGELPNRLALETALEPDGQPEDGRSAAGTLGALHNAALAIAAPVPADPGAVTGLLHQVLAAATEALGAQDGLLALLDDPVWGELLPDTGPDVPTPEVEGRDAPATTGRLVTLVRAGSLWRVYPRATGATAHALAYGAYVAVADTAAPGRFGPYPRLARRGIRSFSMVPLRATQRVVGVLSVSFARPHVPSPEIRAAQELFAAHAGAALERVRLVYAERRRANQSGQFATTLAQVGAAHDPETALEALLHGAVSLLGGDLGVARLFDTRTGERVMRLRLHRDGRLEVTRTREAMPAGSTGARLRDGAPGILVEDYLALDPAIYPFYEQMRQGGSRSAVNVPIEAGGQRIGSLHVNHHHPGFFGDTDLALAKALATQAGAAIERARLLGQLATVNDELQRLSASDGLTGAANRRAFDEHLALEWEHGRRRGAPLSLVLFDVDRFKTYNDTFGHLAGDACLRRVADALAAVARRPHDLVARYGGEEFALLLPATDVAGAARLAEAARQGVETLAFMPAGGRVTVSAGVATRVPAATDAPETLLAAADQALYRAKRHGRNRVAG